MLSPLSSFLHSYVCMFFSSRLAVRLRVNNMSESEPQPAGTSGPPKVKSLLRQSSSTQVVRASTRILMSSKGQLTDGSMRQKTVSIVQPPSDDAIAEDERGSLFNSDDSHIWWLPRKPTKLFMLDVIARAQSLTNETPWYIMVPSGLWRVAWSYLILLVATADVVICVGSCSCLVPYTGWFLVVAQFLFAIDMALNFVNSYITPRGTLEFDPKAIAREYVLHGPFLVDLCALLPLRAGAHELLARRPGVLRELHGALGQRAQLAVDARSPLVHPVAEA